MSELKPCPWCDETPEVIRRYTTSDGELIDDSYKVCHFCSELYCLIETRWHSTKEAAADSWNWRHDDGD